jgi:hypothetical protein
MSNKLLNCLVAGVLGTALTFAAPALARGGGGGGGHGGGFGGGHFGGGGMHFGGMGGGAHFGGTHWGGMGGGGGARFAAARWGGTHWSGMGRGTNFAHAGFSPRFSRFAFHNGRFFHHRFHRFAFVGAPDAYASYYDDFWRRVWTNYGLQWVNVCGGYGY